jgi:hypothetical protein
MRLAARAGPSSIPGLSLWCAYAGEVVAWMSITVCRSSTASV